MITVYFSIEHNREKFRMSGLPLTVSPINKKLLPDKGNASHDYRKY